MVKTTDNATFTPAQSWMWKVFVVIVCICIAIFGFLLFDSSISKTYTGNRVASLKRQAMFAVGSSVVVERDLNPRPAMETKPRASPADSLETTESDSPPAKLTKPAATTTYTQPPPKNTKPPAECKSYTWKGKLWKEFMPEHHYHDSKAVPQNTNVYLSPEYKTLLAKNQRPYYKAVAKNLHSLQRFDASYLTVQLGTFNDAMVTKSGRIYAGSVGDEDQANECVATASGGCWFDIRDSDHIGATTDVKNDFANVVDYKDRTIVTLAVSVHGAEVWHFVMENLAAMAVLEGRNEQNFLLHLSERNAFVDTWLKLVLPMISEDRIIGGNVKTKRLLVPSLNCGNPRPMHVEWLRRRLFLNPIFNTTLSDLPLLVTRTRSRQVGGWSLFSSVAHRDHDDSHLGSVIEQLQAFHISKAVIAPHGAGLVNLVATNPGTCVVELMPPTNVFNICYMQLSYLLGLRYFGIIKSSITPKDVTDIKKFLLQCKE